MNKLLTALALFWSINAFAGQVTFEDVDPSGLYPNTPRIPAVKITASQDSHVFTFAEYLAGETIEIVSNDTIVYTSVIGEDGTVTVPDNLVGDFTLVLYVGDKMYSAEVEL